MGALPGKMKGYLKSEVKFLMSGRVSALLILPYLNEWAV